MLACQGHEKGQPEGRRETKGDVISFERKGFGELKPILSFPTHKFVLECR